MLVDANFRLIQTGSMAKVGQITTNTTMPDAMFIMTKRVYKAWTSPIFGYKNSGDHLRGNILCINLPYSNLRISHIRENDFYVSSNKLRQYVKGDVLDRPTCERVVASNVEMLYGCTDVKMPLIPQSFIDNYIEEYNKGNKIDHIKIKIKLVCHLGHDIKSIDSTYSYDGVKYDCSECKLKTKVCVVLETNESNQIYIEIPEDHIVIKFVKEVRKEFPDVNLDYLINAAQRFINK